MSEHKPWCERPRRRVNVSSPLLMWIMDDGPCRCDIDPRVGERRVNQGWFAKGAWEWDNMDRRTGNDRRES